MRLLVDRPKIGDWDAVRVQSWGGGKRVFDRAVERMA